MSGDILFGLQLVTIYEYIQIIDIPEAEAVASADIFCLCMAKISCFNYNSKLSQEAMLTRFRLDANGYFLNISILI